MRRSFIVGLFAISSLALSDTINPIQPINPIFNPNPVSQKSLEIPITPFSNMASGYQATNPGFRAVIKDSSGNFVAGGPLTIQSVIKGYSDDASQGSAYGQLVLSVDITEQSEKLKSSAMNGTYSGSLDICMARDTDAPMKRTVCKNLSGNIHPDRPFQWLNKKIEFQVKDSTVKVTRYYGYTGDGGTSRQLSLAAFHAAYGFCAPGKAFKDYQSPIVLDLNKNGKLDLVNVWNDSKPIRFDLNGDGNPIRTGWVAPGDGILFEDNGSGCAQDGTQFFGEFTNAKDGKQSYKNGFVALKSLYGSKSSRFIKSNQHAKLKVWRDLSQDGICQLNEVTPAKSHFSEISVKYTELNNPPLNEDNEVRLIGHYVDLEGKKQLAGDVWFKQRRHEKQLANN